MAKSNESEHFTKINKPTAMDNKDSNISVIAPTDGDFIVTKPKP